MSVGSKGVTTDGIVFSLDSFNLKSYLLDTTQEIVVATESYAPYYGFTPSTTLSLPGNLAPTWTQYIVDANGSVPIYLYGGSIDETYEVSSVIYNTNDNITILHSHGTGSITITQSCVMNDTWYGGPLIVKVPGVDLSSLGIYASLNNNSLDLLLSGGISSTISTTASYIPYIDVCWPPPCGNIPTLVGYSNKVLNNINSHGGTMIVELSGGTPETYIATGAFTNYDVFGEPSTILYGLNSNYVTHSSTCIISAPWGFDMIIYQNFDLTTFLRIYNNDNTTSIAFNLYGGATNEVFYADKAYFDGVDTYIYSSSYIGTQYSDHTNFDIYIRSLNQLSNTDNTIASYYDIVEPEVYSVQQFYFDGNDTYLYDNSGIGASYSGNTQFSVSVLSILGTQYDNHTSFTYSHLAFVNPSPTVVSNLKSDSTVPVSFNLANGLTSNKKEFLFDGIDDYIEVGNLGAFTSFTLDIWFNSSSHTDYRNILDFNGGNSGVRIEQTVGYSSNWLNGGTGLATCGLVFNSNASQYIGIGGVKTTGFYQDHWNNIIIRYDGGTNNGVIYLNGEKIVDVTVDFIGGIYNMRIGDGYDYSSRRFQGRIPYVTLYNKSISEIEALNNYNALKWRFI